MNLKTIFKIMIDENVPRILEFRASIKKDMEEKSALQVRINQINIDIDEKMEKVSPCEDAILDLMTEHSAKKLITNEYAIERGRNVNPTVKVVDLKTLPKRFIIERPKADKRLIQSEFVNNQTMPPGVQVEYGQFLKITERKTEDNG